MSRLGSKDVAFLRAIQQNDFEGGRALPLASVVDQASELPDGMPPWQQLSKRVLAIVGLSTPPNRTGLSRVWSRQRMARLVSMNLVSSTTDTAQTNRISAPAKVYRLGDHAADLRPDLLSYTGSAAPVLAVRPNGRDGNLLTKRKYYDEYGYYQRIELSRYEHMPGIAVVRAYSADVVSPQPDKLVGLPPLRFAKAADERPFLFLISKNLQNDTVVTARMDRHHGGLESVEVAASTANIPELHEPINISMLEAPTNYDEDDLIRVQGRRAVAAGIDPSLPLETCEAGRIYSYMTS